jgi:endonuclease YncB( thermonuclease family)
MKKRIFSKRTTKIINIILLLAIFILGYFNKKSGDIKINDPSSAENILNVSSQLSPTDAPAKDNLQKAKVTRIIDGDTIEIDNSHKVRMIGIDTPETVDTKRTKGCFGKEASSFTKESLFGKDIFLEKDVSDKDRYGRLLRYIWTNGTLFNEILVLQGYANTSTYQPDIKYQGLLLAAESKARQEKAGLWGKCPQQ